MSNNVDFVDGVDMSEAVEVVSPEGLASKLEKEEKFLERKLHK